MRCHIGTVVRCTQSDFLLHVKRWMLKFELTHKCAIIQPLFLFSTWSVPGGGVYAHFMHIYAHPDITDIISRLVTVLLSNSLEKKILAIKIALWFVILLSLVIRGNKPTLKKCQSFYE